MKSVTIIGAYGQMGTDLSRVFFEKDWNVIRLSHEEIQIENFNSVYKILSSLKTDFVVSTAAFHNVIQCESQVEKAWKINARGICNVVNVGLNCNFRTVYISTDYVFDGKKGNSYIEEDDVSPINVYGQSKAAGELATISSSENNLVLRISSVFGKMGTGGKGGNFVETMIRKAFLGEKLQVVDDTIMSPTYTLDASRLAEKLISQSANGIYHLSNSGSTSWYDFTKSIFSKLKLNAEVVPISTPLNPEVKRPSNSSMNVEKAASVVGEIYPWENALDRYLKEKGHKS